MTFCNMCFKAGKSEKEYTSHWLRDRPGPSGVVVCPYLLSIECRYCHAKGHTVTRCPILANKNKQIKKSHASSVLPPLGTPPPLVMPQKKVKVEVVEPEPLVLAKSDEHILGKRKFTPNMSWADMCDSDEDDDEF